jgi:hypothetical protein
MKNIKGASDLADPESFMEAVGKDLKKKQDFLKSKQKTQNEEFKHLRNTHKLEKELTKAKKSKTGSQTDQDEGEKEVKHKEVSFDFENWKKKFIFPYLKGVSETIQCEDEAGIMREYWGISISSTEDLINTKLLEFPLEAISTRKDYLTELQSPIVTTIEEVQKDLYKFQKEFPKDSLPWIDVKIEGEENINLKNTNSDKYQLKLSDVNNALKRINSPDVARLIGLVSHFTYWWVFGHVNQIPLDEYHKRQLFISITQVQSHVESSNIIKKGFTIFTMPMIILAVRTLVDHIFKNTYKLFYEEERHETIISKLINDVITILLDPNMFYSRFSFFESEKDAMRLTYHKARASKLPKINSKLFTRSALMKSLFPVPSEGKVRAMFGHSSQDTIRAKTSIGQKRRQTNISTQESYGMHQRVTTTVPGNRPRRMISRVSTKPDATTVGGATFRTTSRARTSHTLKRNQYETTLNMISKVQMFQIAVNKVNKNLVARKKPPIFKLNK